MSIGRRFYELRRALGLNQTDFGRPILLSQTTVGQMESDSRPPTERTIILTIDKWHCSETWLRTGEGEMFASNEEDFLAELSTKYKLNAFQQNLVRIVYDMPPAYQEMIQTLARRLAVEEGLEEPEPEESDRDRTARIARAALAEYDLQQEDAAEDKRA